MVLLLQAAPHQVHRESKKDHLKLRVKGLRLISFRTAKDAQ